jgi:hypothetical protein
VESNNLAPFACSPKGAKKILAPYEENARLIKTKEIKNHEFLIFLLHLSEFRVRVLEMGERKSGTEWERTRQP